MTLEELKRLCERVLQLPPNTSFYSVEVYEALQPIVAARADLRGNCPGVVSAEIDRLVGLQRALRSRKYEGAVGADIPEETWSAMRAASLAGENRRSISRRFGVLLNSITARACADRGRGLPWGPKRAKPDNVVHLFPRRSAAR